jgi:hypothetical protein
MLWIAADSAALSGGEIGSPGRLTINASVVDSWLSECVGEKMRRTTTRMRRARRERRTVRDNQSILAMRERKNPELPSLLR